MNKVTYWFGMLKWALICGIAVSAIYTSLDVLYVNEAAATGVDPLEAASNWDLSMPFNFAWLASSGAGIFLIVSSIGFVLRSAQWLKSQDNAAVRFKPGWAIAGYLIPVISVIVPFMFQWDLNKGGFHTEKSKKQTKSLLISTLVFSVVSSALLRSSLTDFTFFLSDESQEMTLEEFVGNEWNAINGSLFDIIGMIVLFFAVRNIYTGLLLRSESSVA
jgi:hypothetical protein